MKNIIYLLLVVIVSCTPKKKELSAQEIIDKTILVSGTNSVENSLITFDFRDKHYRAKRNKGSFLLERHFKKDTNTVVDVLTNANFKRLINSKEILLKEDRINAYSNSVNSVHYFSVLPFGLNDKAVFKKKLQEVFIKGQSYFKVQVTFKEDGGGEDFDDVFIYWINKESFKVDYLAYKYHTNGGGIRFRELKEQCFKGGIRFVDYNNYKPSDKKISFTDIDKAYENGNLKKLSEIILKNIEVKLIDDSF